MRGLRVGGWEGGITRASRRALRRRRRAAASRYGVRVRSTGMAVLLRLSWLTVTDVTGITWIMRGGRPPASTPSFSTSYHGEMCTANIHGDGRCVSGFTSSYSSVRTSAMPFMIRLVWSSSPHGASQKVASSTGLLQFTSLHSISDARGGTDEKPRSEEHEAPAAAGAVGLLMRRGRGANVVRSSLKPKTEFGERETVGESLPEAMSGCGGTRSQG